MGKDISFSLLLDYYGNLLTNKQRDALEMYYNMDYSLSEIAENLDVSRQCARDFIKKGEVRLLAYEEKIGFLRRTDIIAHEAENIRQELNAKREPQEIKAAVEKSVSRILGVIEGN